MDLDGRPFGDLRIGQRASRSRLVSRRDIELFTELSGDHARPGVPDGRSAGADGGTAVAGGVTAAVLHTVVTRELPGPGTVLLRLDLRFRAAVRPADVITGTVEVTAVRPEELITELSVVVTRDDGAVAAEGTALCRTGSPDDAPPEG